MNRSIKILVIIFFTLVCGDANKKEIMLAEELKKIGKRKMKKSLPTITKYIRDKIETNTEY